MELSRSKFAATPRTVGPLCGVQRRSPLGGSDVGNGADPAGARPLRHVRFTSTKGLGAGLAIAAGHDLGELEVALRIAGP